MSGPDEIADILALIEGFGGDGSMYRDTLTRLAKACEAQAGAMPYRWQDDCILALVEPGQRILDLGCGAGELLERLVRDGKASGQGVELEHDEVAACIERGVPVIQADIDEGLKPFADASFDLVVLEETLQTLYRPDLVLHEMLRVGRRGVVSFPNFGYWRVRLDLVLGGRMPRTGQLPHRWYDTPNIHLFTVEDFRSWATKHGMRIVDGRVLCDNGVRDYQDGDNLHAVEALFVVERQDAGT